MELPPLARFGRHLPAGAAVGDVPAAVEQALRATFTDADRTSTPLNQVVIAIADRERVGRILGVLEVPHRHGAGPDPRPAEGNLERGAGRGQVHRAHKNDWEGTVSG